MPRNYKRKKPVTTSAQTMQDAVDAVKDGMSIRIAANAYGVPKSTLLDKCKQNHTQKVGRPTIFSPEEEESFVEALITLADWGFPLVIQELKELVKSCLDRSGRQINEFLADCGLFQTKASEPFRKNTFAPERRFLRLPNVVPHFHNHSSQY